MSGHGAPDVVSGVEASQTPAAAPDPGKKKRDKVRSAWISFAGRIVAQLVGAIATVTLGVMVLNRSMADRHPPPVPPTDSSTSQAAGIPPKPGEPTVTVIIVTPGSPAPSDHNGEVAPSTHPKEHQIEVARAIAKAVAGAIRPPD
jgi:hypothetical protein